MHSRKLSYSLIIAGMSLGTAWAIRGQFGHEQGAAWAGAIGGLCVILLAKREDWYQKAFQAALASALGWGLGGMISYGMVVGYGRGVDFGNVYYGLTMLFLIGSLFGFLGGGLFGLALASNRQKPVHWPALLVEMAVGGMAFYHFLVGQLGWLMTPPRSEAWAACLGMSAAVLWYILRNKQFSPLRVAVFSGFGAGFGFAFGNFLQVLGAVSEIQFNFWNVMEYSIGFFGGVGMAYGTFTSQWDISETTEKKRQLLTPVVFLVLIIPFIVWEQSFGSERLAQNLKAINRVGSTGSVVYTIQAVALFFLLFTAIYWIYRFYPLKDTVRTLKNRDVWSYFVTYFGLYMLFSLLITCSFLDTSRWEQYLYLPNLLVIAFLIGKLQPPFSREGRNFKKWITVLLITLAILALLAGLTKNIHGELPGAQKRFEVNQL